MINRTYIQPGFIDTDMVKDVPSKMLMISPQEAAEQIYTVIKHKKEYVYASKRWCLVAWLRSLIPDWLLLKLV